MIAVNIQQKLNYLYVFHKAHAVQVHGGCIVDSSGCIKMENMYIIFL